VPNVKLMTKADVIRLNNRAIEHGYEHQIDLEVCGDLMDGMRFYIRGAVEAGAMMTARVFLTVYGSSALLDMTREDYDALPSAPLP